MPSRRTEPMMIKKPQPRFEVDQAIAWYAVRVSWRLNQVAKNGFKRWGFVHWQPLAVFDKVYPNGRVRELQRNVLVRYILVGVGQGAWDIATEMRMHPLHLLENVIGVETIIAVNGRPAQIKANELQNFADRIADEKGPLPGPLKFEFKVGDAAIVGDGPFASFPGIVEEIDIRELSAKVAVSIFGRTTPVEVSLAHLQAA